MNPSFSIGRIAGVKVGLNWSWLIVFALIVWSLSSGVFPSSNPGLSGQTYVVMAVVAAVLFFASLLLHELGHAVQARREGMEIDGITLWLFGGVARFKGQFPSAGAEFRIAIAGPLVTLVLGLAFVGLAIATRFSEPADGVAAWLGYINLLLLVFNLLPALPLDGGRVLRSILWRAKHDLRWATALATRISRGFGFLLIAGGVVLFFFEPFSGIWVAVMGWFLRAAADAEQQYSRASEELAGLHVADLMVRNPLVARPDQTIAEFMADVARTARHHVYPVVRDGEFLGLLPLSRIADVPRDEWARRRVSERMLENGAFPVLSADDDLIDAFAELGEAELHRAVVLQDRRLVGLLSLADITRLLARQAA
jgi:Zn-dependent protease/predicted transcriptional regulator